MLCLLSKSLWGLQGFQSVYKPKRSGTVSFAELLDAVASVDPEMRIRFTSPHPKEFSDEVLQVSSQTWPCDHYVMLHQYVNATAISIISHCRGTL